jgi:hypothetical protein
MCLQIDPSARYHLQRLNTFFEDVVQEISPPSINIRPNLFQTVPHHLTVSEIENEAGIESGLVQELKLIFKNRNWLDCVYNRLDTTGLRSWIFIGQAKY